MVRKDDLLPSQIRLMTSDGLRFVASYRGLINLASSQKLRGGPNAERWAQVARRVSDAIDAEDEDGVRAGLESFSSAARFEGWWC